MKQSLKFLSNAGKASEQVHQTRQQLQSMEASVNGVEAKLGSITSIEQYLTQRQEVLRQQLGQFPQLRDNLLKINKQAYYYSAQIKAYKQQLQDPSRIEENLLREMRKLPSFQQFMAKNSALSALFASPGSFSSIGSSSASMPVVNGLPSRASLQEFVQANLPAGTLTSPVERVNQQLPDLSSLADDWKSKLNQMGKKGDVAMPDFKPNAQHTKSFKNRLEYGSDLQLGKSVSFLPATAAVALTLGYKLNDKSSVGGGASYMIGLGHGWKDISFSTQSLGLRSYINWKLKKHLDLQGGSEWNYRVKANPPTQFRNAGQWQQSALLGLRKTYSAGKKLKGNIQVLYDFLATKHYPISQPVVFRFGYSL